MSMLPDTMTAIAIQGKGGPEVLVAESRAVPMPGPGQVLIRVKAAGVNRPDVLQRKGGYAPPPGASDLPGLEVAGTVAALGPDAGRWQVGDPVCALVSGGGYAEFCAAPVAQCLPIPPGLSMVEAGGVPETFFTVWTNVFDRGRLQAGERLLVHGGSSGIGTTAIQMAKALGATVYVTAGSAEKCAACVRLGADLAIDHTREDFVARVKEATGGQGVDVILDMVGGDYIAKNVASLAIEGRLVNIAHQTGSVASLNFMTVMLRRLTITGSTLRARTAAQKAQVADGVARDFWPLLETGRVKPVVDSVFTLEKAAEAHARMATGAHAGKIVLTVA